MREISKRTFGYLWRRRRLFSVMTSMYPALARFSSSTCSSLNLGQPHGESALSGATEGLRLYFAFASAFFALIALIASSSFFGASAKTSI